MAKRFHRIAAGKKIGGVCTGLADYFNFDVTLVRVLFVVLVLASVGSAALAYIILWVVAPLAAEPESRAASPGTGASGAEPRT